MTTKDDYKKCYNCDLTKLKTDFCYACGACTECCDCKD